MAKYLVDDSEYSGRRPIILDNVDSVLTFLGNLEIRDRAIRADLPKIYSLSELEIEDFM
jgi:hypothetical protein